MNRFCWNSMRLGVVKFALVAGAVCLESTDRARWTLASPGVRQEEQHSSRDLRRQLQTILDSVVEQSNYPGATLAVVLPDGELMEFASGVQDRESQTPMPTDARMLLGSTGKTFVSAVVLQLIDEGLLRLDDPVSKYFAVDRPSEAWYSRLPNGGDLTVRMLLNHTSGLPRYVFDAEFVAALRQDRWKAWRAADQLAFVLDDALLHPAGKGWSYSDTNYLVLGMIVERVTGHSFYREAQGRIIDPLQLKNTLPSTQPELEGLIPGYIGDNNFFSLPTKTLEDGKYVMNPQFEWCGGGFVSSSGVLARWLFALHSGQVLSESAHESLVSAVDLRTGQPADYGYGLGSFVWRSDAGPYWGHAGIMPGYVTQIEFNRDHRFALALQVNTDQGLGQALHRICQRFGQTVIEHLQSSQESPVNSPVSATLQSPRHERRSDDDSLRRREREAEPLYQAALDASAQNRPQEAILDAIAKALAAGACPTRTLTESAFGELHGAPRFRQSIRDHARQSQICMVVPGEAGDPLLVSGRVIDRTGKPVPGA